MRWLDKDPDGNVYWNRDLPASAKKWKLSDFKIKGNEVFNYNFIHARMTDEELRYLHSLIEEFKDITTDSYRKLQIWRSLNWAPVSEQFAYVMPKFEKLKKFSTNVTIKTKTSGDKTQYDFLGVWVEQFDETFYQKNDENILSFYDISPNKPDFNNYPNHSKSNFLKTLVPVFVLDRFSGEKWDVSSGIENPFASGVIGGRFVDLDGNEVPKIGNLDSLIRAKMNGNKYRGKDIPDQEIIHYLRRKYGFGYAVDNSYNTFENGGLPQCHYYVIPFYDDEPNKPLNLGEYIPTLDAGFDTSIMVDKSVTIQKQINQTITNQALIGRTATLPTNYLRHNTIMSITNNLISSKINSNKIQSNYLPTWNQIFHFSTIRAYWRASKILNEVYNFSKFIEKGLENKEVLAVAGEIGKTPTSNEFDDALLEMSGQSEKSRIDTTPKTSIFFISANKSGPSSYKEEVEEETRVSAIPKIKKIKNTEDFHERPWNTFFQTSKGGINSFASDRSIRKNGECYSSTQYFRNILFPNISPYISQIFYDDIQITYTKKALDRRALFYKPLWSDIFGDDKFSDFEKEAIKSVLGEPLESLKYGDIVKGIKSIKTPVFGGIIGIVVIVEICGTAFHSFEHAAHSIVHGLEYLLTAYKVTGHIAKNDVWTAVRDVSVMYIGFWLGKGAPFRGEQLVSKGLGGVIGIAITIGVFLYDRWNYSKEYHEKMDKFFEKINEATEKGFLEGPYAQSLGSIRIKKGPNGELPIKFSKTSDGKSFINEYENFQVVKNENKTKSREELNKEFLKINGDGERLFFSQLTEIECQTLLDIAGNPNPNTGKYNNILNMAPNHLDIGAFKIKEGGKYSGYKIKKNAYGIPYELYFQFTLNDNFNTEPDLLSMNRNEFYSKPGNELSINEMSSPPLSDKKIIFTPFKYTRAPIDRYTNLITYLYGTVPSTEMYSYESRGYIQSFKYKLPVTVTDKEKVWLIRKKYNLDDVVPGSDCCSVFDVPVNKNKFPITSNCEYVIDFASPEFIKKVQERCGKLESRDKQTENLNNANRSFENIATLHTDVEERRVQLSIKNDYNLSKDQSRQNKRTNTIDKNYEGSSITTQNLAQLPRFGQSPLIPGSPIVSNNVPTDSQTSQLFVFEEIDTERTNTTDRVANVIIDVFGTILTNFDLRWRDARSTPLESGGRIWELVENRTGRVARSWRTFRLNRG
jgi:hypothetical protein